jgi:hypothetical protein
MGASRKTQPATFPAPHFSIKSSQEHPKPALIRFAVVIRILISLASIRCSLRTVRGSGGPLMGRETPH